MPRTVEGLLEQANSAEAGTASVNSAKRTFADEPAAGRFFGQVVERLRDIGKWTASSSVSSYALFDDNGTEISGRPITPGHRIRISVYGSGKYDWVEVIDESRGENEFVLTVKPTWDPTATPVDRSAISHFFTDEARNNFCILHTGPSVALYVIGIGERANTSKASGYIEAARNLAANAGSYVGLQSAMWTEFCKNMLHPDEGD
jgi:hypothetical protein